MKISACNLGYRLAWLLPACLFACGTASAADFDPSVRAPFNSITLPEVTLSNAPMPEVFAFLAAASRENNSRENVKERLPLSFNSDLPPAEQAKKRFTLNARFMPLHQIINHLCGAWGLHAYYGHNSVTLMRSTGPVLRRVYDMQPHILTGNLLARPAKDSGDQTPGGRLVTFFSRLGIPFPAGTGIAQVPFQSRIIVRNTQANLFALDEVIVSINQPALNTEVTARLLEVTNPDAITDEHGYVRLYDKKQELNTHGVRVVAEISTIVISGSVGRSRIKALAAPTRKGGRPLTIEAFLQVKPLWFDYARRVDLDLDCSFRLQEQSDKTSKPQLHYEINSRVSGHNGSRQHFAFHGPPLLNASSEDADANGLWYIVVGARRIDPVSIVIPGHAAGRDLRDALLKKATKATDQQPPNQNPDPEPATPEL